ncbi:DNA cytosine methyltransferase [Paenibacillus macerans]|uniref:DNA cytosine methyltransferase n=1 Tax=Paenibacillus macerans TaxID=44252 RepID=UPI00201C31B1|nr:DNA cytosine methyltransferase [Paenibacillus macerans]
MESVAFCEREPFPRKVIAKHYPGRPIYDDVCTLTREVLERDEIIGPDRAIDIISAGFPCQPFSHAGQRAGTEDERYLWPEVVRVVADVGPTWFVGENVAGLLSMAEPDGKPQVESRVFSRSEEEDFYEAILTQQEIMLLGRICQDLENIGYEVVVLAFPAAAVGASHPRERIGIVAHTKRIQCSKRCEHDIQRGRSRKAEQIGVGSNSHFMGNSTSPGLPERGRSDGTESDAKAGAGPEPGPERSGENVAHSKSIRQHDGNDDENERPTNREIHPSANSSSYSSEAMAYSKSERCGKTWGNQFRGPKERAAGCCTDVADSHKQYGNNGGYDTGTIFGKWKKANLSGSEAVANSSGTRQQERHSPTVTNRSRYGSWSGFEGRDDGSTQSGMGGTLNELSAWMDGRGVNPLDAFAEFISNYPQPALMGMPQHDWEPPRVATGIENRTPRLKALGNAVNPLQFFPIMAAIRGIDQRRQGQHRDVDLRTIGTGGHA